MWSFEGEHRKRPNVSLSGASRLDSKTAFLEKLRKEREARENNKKREVAAVRLQAFIRGYLCRTRTNHQCRKAYNDLLHSAASPLTQPVAKALCLKMLHMFKFKHDANRLVLLCSLLVRNSFSLLEWAIQEPQVWPNILAQILHLSLDIIANPATYTGDSSSSTTVGPSHAGPLRLLEVVTQPQYLPSEATLQQYGSCIFSVITPLIKTGYFQQLIKLLVDKVPEVDEKTCKMSSPLASSLLNLIVYPIFLVATCRRPSEHWDPMAFPNVDLPFVAALKPKKQPTACTDSTDKSQSQSSDTEESKLTTSAESELQSSSADNIEIEEQSHTVDTHVSQNPTVDADALPGESNSDFQNRTVVEPMDEGSNSSTESNSLAKSIEYISVVSSDKTSSGSCNRNVKSKTGKSSREEDTDEGDKGKFLRISDPDGKNEDNSTVAVIPPKCSPETSGKLMCYAFGDVATVAPANFINLTLYKLVEEVFASSKASQVYNYLVPCIEDSNLLLRHPSATHALIQAVHMVLADSTPQPSGAHGKHKSSKAADSVDFEAPSKLVVLLTLVPMKTVLPTTSLQLYLQFCKRLVGQTVQFLPVHRRQISDGGDYEMDSEEELDDSDLDDDDDEDTDDLKVVTSGARYRPQHHAAPSELMIQLGEWCLSHINSPGYVSWLLDEVENTKLDPEVLTEFCGLTHTLLTAPCLTLFQCRLMYGVVGRQQMQRAMWSLLVGLYPSWVTAPTQSHDWRSRGSRRLLDTVSRGSNLEPRDRDTLVPVLVAFVTTTLAVLATLHDSELLTSPPDSLESLLYSMKEDSSEDPAAASSADGVVAARGSSFPFGAAELVIISGTLRDVCVGLAELAHPDTRASTSTDVAYKPIWDHCFGSCVDVVRQLHLRDTRRKFCPPGHWLTSRVSLPEVPQTASFRSLLRNRGASRQRTFMPTRWKTRAKLMDESESGSNAMLGRYERIRATVLQELPFVFSFTDRAEVFLRLVQEDRSVAQQNSSFNVGPSISIRVRRTHLYEDSFEKLSPSNEPNMRLHMRVKYLNAAGALEAGVDGGGLFREFLSELLRSAFDPNRGFFLMTRENTLYPNPSARLIHDDIQSHFYFIGRMLGKALYEKLLVEIPLAGFFLSKLLSRKGFSIEFHHLDSLDPELCKNLLYLKTHKGDVQELGLDFTVLISELGHNTIVELIPDGANIPVTSENKIEYIYRMADFKLNKQIAKQCYAFRKGLHDVVPAEWLQLFDWKELQTMISGAAAPVNIADLKENSKYAGEYFNKHPTIKLFWQVVEQFNEKQRGQLLKFVTSCSRPPLLGFKDLCPPFCIQPSGSDQRLPSAATCMNLLKLPEYSDPITLKEKLLYSITSNAGFELS
uniref:Ubiquitin-protein ligase E3C n=1 Tax=Hirondellea gigas TaxID=1518452 RepID=A0A6A7FRB2_9CRUS